MSKTNKTNTVSVFILWILSGIIAITGLGMLATSTLGGLVFMLLGLFVSPYITNLMAKKVNFRPSKKLKMLISIGLIVLASIVSSGSTETGTINESNAKDTKEVVEEPEVNKEDKASHGPTASVCAENYMEKQLKSPSSAKFAWKVPTRLSANKYILRSHVDSQNSFGAMLRTEFLCEMEVMHEHDYDCKVSCVF